MMNLKRLWLPILFAGMAISQATGPRELERGYIIDFRGTIIYTPKVGVKRKLVAADISKRTGLKTGDKITAIGDKASACILVEGYCVPITKKLEFTVGVTDHKKYGKTVTHLVSAGGGMNGDPTARTPKIAIFSYTGPKRTGEEKLVPLADGTLPIVWIADKSVKEIQIELKIPGAPAVKSDWIDTKTNGVPGFPFGSTSDKKLGQYLIEHADPNLQIPVQMVLRDRANPSQTRTYQWALPKQQYLNEAVQDMSFNKDLTFFEVNSLLVETETRNGGLPSTQAYLTYQYWRTHKSQFVAKKMMASLCDVYDLPKLSKALLTERP